MTIRVAVVACSALIFQAQQTPVVERLDRPTQPARVAPPPPARAGAAVTTPCGSHAGIYSDAAIFANHCAQLGVTLQASWGFLPHDLGAGASATLNDPLNITTHTSNANDPWSGPGPSLWPAALGSIQFSSNTTPNGPLTPRGAGGLTYGTSEGNANDVWLTPTVACDSLSIQCEAPMAGSCQGLALDLAGPGSTRVRLQYTNDGVFTLTRDLVVNVPNGGHVFIGFIKTRIIRVDLWNADGYELLRSVSLYRRLSTCPNCAGDATVNVSDLLGVIAHWGEIGTPCDFNGGGVNVTDLLNVLAHWNQLCSSECTGEDQSTGTCIADADCLGALCDHTACIPGTCICIDGVWFCTNDCCGRCI